jgi:hypothetical protein
MNGAVETFNERYPAPYQLLLFAADDDLRALDDIIRRNVGEVLYFCAYRADKARLASKP